MAHDDYGVVVGIKTYPGLTPLEGPCDDAQAFYNWLVSPGKGDVPPGNVKLLLTTDYHPPEPAGINDAHPLEEEVNQLFRPFMDIGYRQEKAGRRLYIYMAGHGFSDPEEMNSAALYAANASPTYAPHVAGTEFAKWLRRNAVFDEIVLVMDCCRTRNPIWRIRPPPLPNTSNPGNADKVKTVFAYATSWGRVSRERPDNGSVRGIFTLALLKALEEAPANQYGRVTGQKLKDYIHNIIDQVASGVDIDPPDIHVDSNRDIVFIERNTKTAFNVNIILQPFGGNEILHLVDGLQNEVSHPIPAAAHNQYNLTPGLYKAHVMGTDRKHLFEVGGSDVEITL